MMRGKVWFAEGCWVQHVPVSVVEKPLCSLLLAKQSKERLRHSRGAVGEAENKRWRNEAWEMEDRKPTECVREVQRTSGNNMRRA